MSSSIDLDVNVPRLTWVITQPQRSIKARSLER